MASKQTQQARFGDAAPSIRLDPMPAQTVMAPTECAERAIGVLTPSVRIMGFTKGQFSLLDLIKAVLAQIGPADLVLSTWTTGVRDADNVAFLAEKGAVRSLMLLTDRSFPTRQPKYVAAVRKAFGDASIVVTHTHAKFALLQNEKFSIVIRSSMNLNRNPRFEQFDLDDSVPLHAFCMQHVADLFEHSEKGLVQPLDKINASFTAALGGGVSDVYKLPDDDVPRQPGWLSMAD